jgi:HAD superfamily hydrolase (TIGR01549 family)
MAMTAIVDIDGTLVDTNFHHALAWSRAFARHGVTVPVWRIHKHIGMGGDQLVAAAAGDEVERALGDQVRAAWTEEFEPLLGEIEPLPGAHELLAALKRRGHVLVLASSGQPKHVEAFIDLVGARDLADAWTSSSDVDKTKPAPDLLAVALDKAGGGDAVAVGDTPWDAEAARRLGVPALAVRTGGFCDQVLIRAGVAGVYDDPDDLLAHLDSTPLGR